MEDLQGLKGPFASEKQFKAAFIEWQKQDNPRCYVFEIENEEKEPGMPDILVTQDSEYTMAEIKLSDKNGVITFQKTQPLFYKQHPRLEAIIIAWDALRNRVAMIAPDVVVAAKTLRYKIPD
jgi:hypothetical protein